MSMKLVEFKGQETIFVRWQTRKPKSGDHMTVYDGEKGAPKRQAARRLLLQERIHCQQWEVDPNMTEEWWSFIEVSESEFQKHRTATNKNQLIAERHDSLF